MSSATTIRMRLLTALLCLLAVTGCYRDTPTAPGPVDQQFTLAPGQSTTIAAAGLRVTFEGVTGDSRCPADVVCIQAGSATVRVTAAAVASGARRDLTFETGDPQPAVYETLTLELVQLAPYPFSSSPIRPEDYRVTLRVRR